MVAAWTVALAGSFNGQDRQANLMQGPHANGEWAGQIDLAGGTYEYKFLVDGQKWKSDPENSERIPDSFGGHNSLVHLGRLARMKESQAQVGDGRIDAVGLAHADSGPGLPPATGWFALPDSR